MCPSHRNHTEVRLFDTETEAITCLPNLNLPFSFNSVNQSQLIKPGKIAVFGCFGYSDPHCDSNVTLYTLGDTELYYPKKI